jgi:hypothetical protein
MGRDQALSAVVDRLHKPPPLSRSPAAGAKASAAAAVPTPAPAPPARAAWVPLRRPTGRLDLPQPSSQVVQWAATDPLSPISPSKDSGMLSAWALAPPRPELLPAHTLPSELVGVTKPPRKLLSPQVCIRYRDTSVRARFWVPSADTCPCVRLGRHSPHPWSGYIQAGGMWILAPSPPAMP